MALESMAYDEIAYNKERKAWHIMKNVLKHIECECKWFVWWFFLEV